jgi:hypothetical protein
MSRSFTELLVVCVLCIFATPNLFAQGPDSLWHRAYGGTSYDYGHSVQQTTDGGYIITGYANFFGTGFSAYLIKTDAHGDTLWTSIYDTGSWAGGWSVQQTTDGGYIIAGAAQCPDVENDLYIVKTDADGDPIWTRTYGGADDERGESVRQTTEAKGAFQKAIDVEPEGPEEGLPKSLIHMLVGNAYRGLGWYADAIEEFQGAIEDSTGSGLDDSYHYYLARTYEDLGEYARALKELQATIDLDPVLWWCEPHLHYFLCLYRLGKKDEAEAYMHAYSYSLKQSDWSPDQNAGWSPVVDFYAGGISESLFIETMTEGMTWDIEAGTAIAHYYLGMAYLLNVGNLSASGPDTAKARGHFEACLATADEEVEEYSCAKVELSRLGCGAVQ